MRALILFAVLLPLGALGTTLPSSDVVPGGVAVMELPASATVPGAHFDGRRVMVVNHAEHWYAIVGIPLKSPAGDQTLQVQVGDEPATQIRFAVRAKHYAEQHLTIKNPKLVNPPASKLALIEQQQAHLQQVFNTWTTDPAPDLSFIWPVDGPQTSGFGLRRFLNGEERSRHLGIDIGAVSGTPVRAPADGVVADVGDYYFCGNTLTINLGQGLYSVYCHLNKIDVRRGARVKQGEIVGAIGATGRTTGANLHWTVSLNGTPVNPHVFIPENVIPIGDRTK
ncbi:MAG: peptidoglycan DD-metalloendopeptidase family protein [Gammaproteobacteria bacterium]